MVQPTKVNSADKFKEIASAQTLLIFKLFSKRHHLQNLENLSLRAWF